MIIHTKDKIMGIFSLFSLKLKAKKKKVNYSDVDYDSYFDKDFFASVVGNSKNMMLYFLNKDGWIGANQTFFNQMNFKTIEEFRESNESIRDIFESESEEIFTESDKSWLDYIRKHYKNGYRITLLDGDKKNLVIDAKSHIISKTKGLYVLELEDVTELYNAHLKTKEVEQLKTKFLANIGHEFRTPMNGILGFIEILQKTHLDKQQREYLGMINHSSKNLMTNIETLLDLSQLQGGRLELNPFQFNILPEIEKLVHDFCLISKDKGIKVFTFIDPKLPQDIFSDAKKILQVLYAILQNAIKFTPRGGKVVLEVKLLKRQKNGDCSIGFSVSDTGKGISNEQVQKITEPFTSGNQADERLGVGLSLSHGLVKLLGSDLRIQSQDGSGTYVNFVLDFKETKGQNFKMISKRKVKVLLLDQTRIDEANFLTTYLRSFAIDVVKSNQLDENVYEGIDALYIVANQDDSSWMLELGTYTKTKPLILLLDYGSKLQTKLTHIIDQVIQKPLLPSSIAQHLYSVAGYEEEQLHKEELSIQQEVKALVVEDNLINQRLIQILLQGYNITVTTAGDGVEAVHYCSKNKYDVVFMDIDMPEKNGMEATKEIKASTTLNKLTPIIALTAMAMEGDKEMILENGLDDYMPKPLTRDKLEFILNKYLKVTA